MKCFREMIISFDGMNTKRINLRIDERTHMQLCEIAERLHVGISVIIRTVLRQGIDQVTDKEGNIQLNEK